MVEALIAANQSHQSGRIADRGARFDRSDLLSTSWPRTNRKRSKPSRGESKQIDSPIYEAP
jgi:hypothetical protein